MQRNAVYRFRTLLGSMPIISAITIRGPDTD